MVRYLIRHVMPGLVPGIHVFLQRHRKQDVDGRDKPGHDDQYRCARSAKAALRDWQDTIADRAPVQSPFGVPECGSAGVSACTPPAVVCPVRIPRATGAITDALGSLSCALNAGTAMLALAAIAAAFQGRLARGFSFLRRIPRASGKSA
jgi:hypothetical protein